MPSIPLYVAPDDDKKVSEKPSTPTMSTWSPSEMSAFAHGSPSWVPPINDPSAPVVVVEPESRTKDDNDLRRMKTLAICGCVVMVVAALTIGSIVLRTGKAPAPELEVQRSTTVAQPRSAVAPAPAPVRPVTTTTTITNTTLSPAPTAQVTTSTTVVATAIAAADQADVVSPAQSSASASGPAPVDGSASGPAPAP
jgi:hypothetical protein